MRRAQAERIISKTILKLSNEGISMKTEKLYSGIKYIFFLQNKDEYNKLKNILKELEENEITFNSFYCEYKDGTYITEWYIDNSLQYGDDTDYKAELLKSVTITEVMEWLKRNPVPSDWKGDKYSYAYTEMPVGSFFTWWRKHILKWPI